MRQTNFRNPYARIRQFAEIIFIVVAGVITLSVLLGIFGSTVDIGRGYSEGSRVGIVTKLSNKGIFCKTIEGSMRVGTTATALPESWNFSLSENSPLVPAIKKAMEEGRTVEIEYTQPLIAGRCTGDSQYRVVGVK